MRYSQMIVISSISKLCKFIKEMEESKVYHKHFSAEGRLCVFHRDHLRCGAKSAQDFNRKVSETSNINPMQVDMWTLTLIFVQLSQDWILWALNTWLELVISQQGVICWSFPLGFHLFLGAVGDPAWMVFCWCTKWCELLCFTAVTRRVPRV